MRKQYTINSVQWYYALLIFGLIMFWAAGMRKSQIVSNTVLQAHDRTQLKTLLSDSDDNVGRVLFYSGLLATFFSSFIIVISKKIYKNFPKIFVLYIALVIAAFWSLFVANRKTSIGFTDLRCDIGVLTVIAYGLVFIGYDTKAWNYILKTLSVLAYATTAMVLIIFLKVLGTSHDVYRRYFIYYIVVLTWIAIVPLYISHGRLGKLPVIIGLMPLLCLALISFASVSRGWILQSLFMCLIVGWKLRKYLLKHLIPVGVIAAVVVYFLVTSTFFEVFFGSYDRLLDRINENTRIGQYETFFEQVSVSDFIQGCGLKAAYVYQGDVDYAHFDNQFITMTFKMGALFILGYLCLIVYPAVRLLNRAKDEDVYPATIVILHVLACLGLSVYYNLELSFTVAVVALCAGRCWYLISRK